MTPSIVYWMYSSQVLIWFDVLGPICEVIQALKFSDKLRQVSDTSCYYSATHKLAQHDEKESRNCR